MSENENRAEGGGGGGDLEKGPKVKTPKDITYAAGLAAVLKEESVDTDKEKKFPMTFKGPGLFQKAEGVESKDVVKPQTEKKQTGKEKEGEKFPLKFKSPGLFGEGGTAAKHTAEHSENLKKGEEKTKPKRTLFLCLDKSKYSKEVIDWCVKKLFEKGDKVVLVHVQQYVPFPMGLYPSLAVDYVAENEKIRRIAYTQGGTFLKSAVKTTKEAGECTNKYK